MVEATDALDALMDMGRELSAAFQQSHNTEARGQFVRETPPGIIPPSMFESGGRTRSTRHGRSRNPTPPTQHYVDWDWTRDALPVVEKYKSILSEFAAREFGKEFRNACQKLRSKGLSAFVGFESFDATSHHELLARLIGLSLEKIAQQNVDALSTFEQAPYPDQLSKLRTALVDETDSVREMRAKLPPLMCPRCNRERDFDDLKLGREWCPDCWQLDADRIDKDPSLTYATWIVKSLKQAEAKEDTNNVNWLKKKRAKFADTLLKIKVELRRIGRLEPREDITIDYAENTLPEIIAELSMSQRPAGETLTIEQARGLRLTELLTYLVKAPDARTLVSGSGTPHIGLTAHPPAERAGSISSSGRRESGPRQMQLIAMLEEARRRANAATAIEAELAGIQLKVREAFWAGGHVEPFRFETVPMGGRSLRVVDPWTNSEKIISPTRAPANAKAALLKCLREWKTWIQKPVEKSPKLDEVAHIAFSASQWRDIVRHWQLGGIVGRTQRDDLELLGLVEDLSQRLHKLEAVPPQRPTRLSFKEYSKTNSALTQQAIEQREDWRKEITPQAVKWLDDVIAVCDLLGKSKPATTSATTDGPHVEPTKKKRTRTAFDDVSRAAADLYLSLWEKSNATEWSRSIANKLGVSKVDPRTVRQTEAWQKATLRRQAASEIIGRMRGMTSLSPQLRDSLTAKNPDIDDLIAKMDDADRRKLKSDPELVRLLKEQSDDDRRQTQHTGD